MELQFNAYIDSRGTLVSINEYDTLPFEIKRVFFIKDIKKNRGNHAHRTCSELILAIQGSFTLTTNNGVETTCHRLSDPTIGILATPYTWLDITECTPDCIIAVFCSHNHDEADNIRNYTTFISEVLYKPKLTRENIIT